MSRGRLTIADFPPRVQDQIRSQLGHASFTPHAAGSQIRPVGTDGTKPRIRQSRHELNKLESAFQDVLRVEYKGHEILAQSLRVRLANGTWFKPDFFIPSLSLAFEVKGPHAFRGGFEFLKMAATQHRWLKFRLVWRKQGNWYRQDILP